jgi:hypothetical protein
MTTPDIMETLLKEMKERKYPVEGKLRKGYAQAHPSIVLPMDIRIKREAVPQFLSDMSATDLGNPIALGEPLPGQANNVTHHIPSLVRNVVVRTVRLLRKVTNHHVPPFFTEENMKNIRPIPDKGWRYVHLFGCYNDPEGVEGNEEL